MYGSDSEDDEKDQIYIDPQEQPTESSPSKAIKVQRPSFQFHNNQDSSSLTDISTLILSSDFYSASYIHHLLESTPSICDITIQYDEKTITLYSLYKANTTVYGITRYQLDHDNAAILTEFLFKHLQPQQIYLYSILNISTFDVQGIHITPPHPYYLSNQYNLSQQSLANTAKQDASAAIPILPSTIYLTEFPASVLLHATIHKIPTMVCISPISIHYLVEAFAGFHRFTQQLGVAFPLTSLPNLKSKRYELYKQWARLSQVWDADCVGVRKKQSGLVPTSMFT